ncbi:MAG: hypothetical protein BMS9Abin26_1775 [Gammaproteobacteria bacterium]|nr:MAG: hypothetical protein BMS9Abin26_1775 [Gammaproteobacteria bacterium]
MSDTERKKHIIARRLVIAMVLFSASITAIISIYQIYTNYRIDVDNIHSRLTEINDVHLASVIQKVWTADIDELRNQLRGILNLSDIKYLEVNENGKVIAAAGTPQTQYFISKDFPLNYEHRGKNTPLGRLVVHASLEGVYDRIFAQVVTIVVSNSVRTVLVVGFVFMLFFGLVTRHLEKISGYTEKMTLDGDERLSLDRKPSGSGKEDELDQVVNAIESMRDNLRDSFEELKQSEERFRVLIESFVSSIVIIDTDENIVMLNDQARTMFGYDPDDLIGNNISSLFHEVDNRCENYFSNYIKDPVIMGACDMECLMGKTKNNSTFPIEISMTPYKTGGHTCIAITVNDISQRIQDEKEKQTLEKQLQQSAKMEAIGQLTGGIAHDFNNLLSVVLGYTTLSVDLARESEDDELIQFLDEIEKAGNRAKDLVAQMLAFSRGEGGEHTEINLLVIVKEVSKLLSVTIPSSIDLLSSYENDLPDIMGDALQLHQVIMNLVINARDAISEKGRIVVDIKMVGPVSGECDSCHESYDGDYIELTVSDNGCGISPDIERRIFEPFFTTKETGKGSGMGLSMVHGIVHSHKGHINVYSKDSGTTFRLLLPIMVKTPQDVVVDAKRSKIAESAADIKGHILVVDDERSVALFISQYLENRGYDTTVMTDSKEAWDLFYNNPDKFDLVITDQTMPGLTGVELAGKILEYRRNMPIILCTGYSETVDANIAKQMGVSCYQQKPLVLKELLANINSLTMSAQESDRL